jgi:hypothetical protein
MSSIPLPHEEGPVSTEERAAIPNLSRSARFYRIHRESELAKKKEAYRQRPDVIAKREERERKQSEKDALRIQKQKEKEEKAQAKLELALLTSRRRPPK